jgi:SAUR family protein
MKNQPCHISWPKNILRLWLWWAPLYQRPPSIIPGKNKGLLEYGGLNETLLKGEFSDGKRLSMQVPKGFLVVYVGPKLQRFVIPTSYLSMPDFRVLMDRAQVGGINPYD